MILKGRSSKETNVQDIMDKPVMCAAPEYSIDECMALMTEHNVKHLPIVENQKLFGIVSMGDLVRSIVEKQEFVINQLEHYIHG